MNRRRYIPEITSDNIAVRNFAERTAVNTPIQGSAADVIKMAMINIYKKMKGMKSRMVLQVHDELVFEVAMGESEKVASLVKLEMENVIKLKIPLKVNLKKGRNWLQMEEVK
jgi:DNA polymerase-1